ncbi:GNAT family N-acetyltransferase [Planifilum fimeticola]
MRDEMDGRIRPARPEEAKQLSDLAFRSKAHWGYDDDFMERCRGPLTVFPGNIAEGRVFVLEDRGRIRGFYELSGAGSEKELSFLFVEPGDIGKGYGRALWLHAVRTAEVRGADGILIHSDPHAEPFYRAMGARRVGEVPSTAIPGRMLPLMRFDLRLPARP